MLHQHIAVSIADDDRDGVADMAHSEMIFLVSLKHHIAAACVGELPVKLRRIALRRLAEEIFPVGGNRKHQLLVRADIAGNSRIKDHGKGILALFDRIVVRLTEHKVHLQVEVLDVRQRVFRVATDVHQV